MKYLSQSKETSSMERTNPDRRDLLKAIVGAVAGTAPWIRGLAEDAFGEQSRANEKLFLRRYDTTE